MTILNDNFDQVTISTGKDDNENNEDDGQSCTQDAKAHLFKYKGTSDVRIIDTPGIGDTR